MATIATGLILAWLNGYILEALALGLIDGVAKHSMIGIGMWLGAIMWFNVWLVIWPSQQLAPGLVEASAEATAASARTAMHVSRAHTFLAVQILFVLVSAQTHI